MLEIDEGTLESINASIDEALSIIEEKNDIRLAAPYLRKVANKIRAMAEIRETPDNRFVAYITQSFLMRLTLAFEEEEEEWFKLNKDLLSQMLSQVKALCLGLKKSLNSKEFESTIDILKIFFFANWQLTMRLAD